MMVQYMYSVAVPMYVCFIYNDNYSIASLLFRAFKSLAYTEDYCNLANNSIN